MEQEAPYDARAVANFILDLADDARLKFTQMKLLKIIYFSHGWFLANYKSPLIVQQFEAWEYGPVVKIVRDCFKHFDKQPITGRAESVDLFTGECEVVEPALKSEHAEFVRQVFLSYCVHDAWELSDMTHERHSPWDKVWNSAEPIGRLSLRIKNVEIQQHFESLPARLGKRH